MENNLDSISGVESVDLAAMQSQREHVVLGRYCIIGNLPHTAKFLVCIHTKEPVNQQRDSAVSGSAS